MLVDGMMLPVLYEKALERVVIPMRAVEAVGKPLRAVAEVYTELPCEKLCIIPDIIAFQPFK